MTESPDSGSDAPRVAGAAVALRHLAAVRGLDLRAGLGLAGSLLFIVLAAQLTVHLRTAADIGLSSPVLDSGILVGLSVPAALISRLAQDRAAWAQATGSRSKTLLRGVWVAVLFTMAVVVGAVGSLLVPGQQFPALLLADGVALTALGLIGAVAVGASLGWVAPVVVALVCSTPGLIPVKANWLVLAEKGPQMLAVAAGLAVAASLLFVALDDYGLAPQRRLIQRIPGVVED